MYVWEVMCIAGASISFGMWMGHEFAGWFMFFLLFFIAIYLKNIEIAIKEGKEQAPE